MCAVAWVAACGPALAEPPSSPDGAKPQDKPGPKPEALIAQAQAVLGKIKQLDYRDPAAGNRVAMRVKAADLYRDACVATREVSPCVWTISLSLLVETDDAPTRIVAATDILGAQCLKESNSEACRIFDDIHLTTHAEYYSNAKALCDKGLASACLAFGNFKSEQRAAMSERGCQLGSPAACSATYSDRSKRGETGVALDEIKTRERRLAEARCALGYAESCSRVPNSGPRVQAVAVNGCTRGYLDDCNIPIDDHTVGEPQLARACELAGGVGGDSCSRLAFMRISPSNPLGVRDAWEHACQFRIKTACAELVNGYRAKTFPEPVSGRADLIVKYLCTTDPTYVAAAGHGWCSPTK